MGHVKVQLQVRSRKRVEGKVGCTLPENAWSPDEPASAERIRLEVLRLLKSHVNSASC
jgi:hypothetical protein